VNDPDMENYMFDSTIMRAHPCAAGALNKSGGQKSQALGRSRGGFSTKIHVGVDAIENPLRFILTPGQVNDIIIKHFRRIFSRFDKLDRSYLGFLGFVAALIWLR
jgi:hypothetical protein